MTGGYFAFCNAKRGEIVAKHPKIMVTDIAQAAGAAWRKLSDAERAKWNALAAEKQAARGTVKERKKARMSTDETSG